MKNPYWSRVWKELRFAAAAIGDESGTCRREAADWEFRSRCFKSFGNYTGDELDGEICTPAKDAKACQDHCAETEGCSFFQFREEAVSCGGHRAENCASCPQVVDPYPFCRFLSLSLFVKQSLTFRATVKAGATVNVNGRTSTPTTSVSPSQAENARFQRILSDFIQISLGLVFGCSPCSQLQFRWKSQLLP